MCLAWCMLQIFVFVNRIVLHLMQSDDFAISLLTDAVACNFNKNYCQIVEMSILNAMSCQYLTEKNKE